MAPCSARTTAITAKPAIVSVNDVAIPRDAIAREVQQHPASSPLAAWKEAARALAIRELLLQEARRLVLVPDPQSDSTGRRETDEEAMIRMLVEQEIAVPEPDREACWRYYENNRRRFRSPDIYEAAHILVSASVRDAEQYEHARAKAAGIVEEAARAPERFADLARAHSDCPSAAQGGNLGQISEGQTTPEFERALKALAPRAITDVPVATRYGFHVIRLDRKIDGSQLPFDAVADRIAAYLGETVRRRATAQYIARLAARASIVGIEFASAESLRVYP
jgi:peptidyl-prolyl cis-trans isomerase C